MQHLGKKNIPLKQKKIWLAMKGTSDIRGEETPRKYSKT